MDETPSNVCSESGVRGLMVEVGVTAKSMAMHTSFCCCGWSNLLPGVFEEGSEFSIELSDIGSAPRSESLCAMIDRI